jgi:hypothetical protein
MNKTSTLLFLLLVLTFAVKGQNSLYDHIQLGDFWVGFADTTLHDEKYDYEAFAYKGLKPYFAQIWFPSGKKTTGDSFMLFNEFSDVNHDGLEGIIQEQVKINKEIIIRDFIAENLETGEANHFGTYSYDDIFTLIGTIQTRSIRQQFPDSVSFPVILYHHGSQSNSFENFAMAEYFASRGFIFVAANFHLPFPNTPFGLKPFDKLIAGEEEGSLMTMLNFVQSLSSSSDIFFIGHSLGAQMGFRALDESTVIKGFVSLETTIEFKNDHQQIQELWPEVYQKIIQENAHYPYPILLCAATGNAEPFDFFSRLNAPQIIFAPTIAQFEHNAYTSLFYLRHFLSDEIPQTDKMIMSSRIKLYASHLDLFADFFNGILSNTNQFGNEPAFID